jgi:hypothetical protein
MLRRCFRCNKLLFFEIRHFKDNDYCRDCYSLVNAEFLYARQKESERKRKELLKKKREQKIRRDKEEYEQIKKDLAKERQKQQQRYSESQKEKIMDNETYAEQKDKVLKDKKVSSSTQNYDYFSSEQILLHPRLLYLEADVKRLLVIEWLDGKKRIALNKNREVRRTHAGGFSAEKFQKFVDFKKQKTFDWVSDQLSRPGILRKPYDIIKVVSKDDELKEAIETFINEL